MERKYLKGIIETLLFITDKPLSKQKIVELIDDKEVTMEVVSELLDELITDYLKYSSLEIRQVAEGYQIATKPEYAEYVRRLYKERTLLKLSPAAVETLAIIAYRQPVTKAEIEETRGVDSTAVIETLLERKLVKIVGRKEVIGRPLLYGTTQEFLKYFGLNSLSDLPPIEQFIETNTEDEEQQLIQETSQENFSETNNDNQIINQEFVENKEDNQN
ncbi:MAG: SMC-Scp complex subunit ScpB [Endomicrobiia bacterium]